MSGFCYEEKMFFAYQLHELPVVFEMRVCVGENVA